MSARAVVTDALYLVRMPRRRLLVRKGDNFVLYGAEMFSRQQPDVTWDGEPTVAPTLADATEYHAMARLESQMRLMVYALVYAATQPEGTPLIFTSGAARIQRAGGGDVRALPSWLARSDVVGAHHARAQFLVNLKPLQDVVPAGQRGVLLKEFSDVSMVSRAHNEIDSRVDEALLPTYLGIINSMASIRHPVTPERITGNLQYMSRAETVALIAAQKHNETLLGELAKKPNKAVEAKLLMKRDIARQLLRFVKDHPVPNGIKDFIEFATPPEDL